MVHSHKTTAPVERGFMYDANIQRSPNSDNLQSNHFPNGNMNSVREKMRIHSKLHTKRKVKATSYLHGEGLGMSLRKTAWRRGFINYAHRGNTFYVNTFSHVEGRHQTLTISRNTHKTINYKNQLVLFLSFWQGGYFTTKRQL